MRSVDRAIRIGNQGFFGLDTSLPCHPFQHRDTGNDDAAPAPLAGKDCDDKSVFCQSHRRAAREGKQIGGGSGWDSSARPQCCRRTASCHSEVGARRAKSARASGLISTCSARKPERTFRNDFPALSRTVCAVRDFGCSRLRKRRRPTRSSTTHLRCTISAVLTKNRSFADTNTTVGERVSAAQRRGRASGVPMARQMCVPEALRW